MIQTTFINSTSALYNDRDLSWVQDLVLSKGYFADATSGLPTFQITENTPNGHSVIVNTGHLLADFNKGGNRYKTKKDLSKRRTV